MPEKGFDWILEKYGTCSAITTLGGGESPFPPEVKNYCVRRLIQTLHRELTERLKAEIKNQQGFEPTATTIAELVEGRDWLFVDDCYHIDLSHLSSVVQMSMQIDVCEEWKLARDLCAYGMKLSPRFQFPSRSALREPVSRFRPVPERADRREPRRRPGPLPRKLERPRTTWAPSPPRC